MKTNVCHTQVCGSIDPYVCLIIFFCFGSLFFLAKCDIERTDVNNISMGLWRDSGRLCLATLPVFALIRGEPHTQPEPSQCNVCVEWKMCKD